MVKKTLRKNKQKKTFNVCKHNNTNKQPNKLSSKSMKLPNVKTPYKQHEEKVILSLKCVNGSQASAHVTQWIKKSIFPSCTAAFKCVSVGFSRTRPAAVYVTFSLQVAERDCDVIVKVYGNYVYKYIFTCLLN